MNCISYKNMLPTQNKKPPLSGTGLPYDQTLPLQLFGFHFLEYVLHLKCMYVCVRGGPNQPLHRDPQWSIVSISSRTEYIQLLEHKIILMVHKAIYGKMAPILTIRSMAHLLAFHKQPNLLAIISPPVLYKAENILTT
jgi:hypothetical protein